MITFTSQQAQPNINRARVSGFLVNYNTQTVTVHVDVLDAASGQVRVDDFVYNASSTPPLSTFLASVAKMTGVRTDIEAFLVAQGNYVGTVS